MTETYPALLNLIRGYFHQDYDLISEDPDEIVRVYREENPPALRKDVIRDIQHFLAQHKGESDEELQESLISTFQPEFGFYCWENRTTGEALTKIVDILSEPDLEQTAGH